MVDMVRIRNSNLDSNGWVNCQGSKIAFNYARRIKVNPVDGQFSGTSYVIAKADVIGVENPIITVRGSINVNDFSNDTKFHSATPSTNTGNSEDGSSIANILNLGYLISLYTDMTGTNQVTFRIGDPDASRNWVSWDLSSTTLTVQILNIKLDPREDSEGNHIIDYEIEMREVDT